MARPLRIQYPGAYYHITCRGNKHRKIFLNDDDRHWFLKVLKESLKIYQVNLYAYILMHNHFHLVIRTVRANLSEFMRRFNITYTGCFNYHHRTCGHLYQGRYKALLVDADSYLVELSRYVHLNPVRGSKTRLCNTDEKWQYAKRYQWSSISGYMHKKHIVDFIEYNTILDMIEGRQAYQRFVYEGINKDQQNIFEDVKYQSILGDQNFAALVKQKYIELGSIREQPMYRRMVMKAIKPEIVISYIADIYGIKKAKIECRSSNGDIRGITAEMLYRYSGITLREIGQLLGGVEYTAVSMLRRRVKKRLSHDQNLSKKYVQLENRLKNFCEM
jgi:putative transposase